MVSSTDKDSTETNVIDLSMTEDGTAQAAAKRIADLPYVTDITMLPDLHFKDSMEAPSSMVAGTKGVIAPYLASAALNCGMGFIATDIDAADVSEQDLERILSAVNREGAKTKFSSTRYRWSRELLAEAMLKGAEPVVKHYGLDESWLSSFENNGTAVSEPVTEEGIKEFVPHFLRTSKFCRSETGINFAGNHFLELQVVDRVDEPSLARQWGLHEGRLGVMYHLGPGPLGGNLINLYESRKKPPLHYKAGYAFFRCIFQAFRGWRFWNTFGRFSPWLEIEEDSPQGRAFAMVASIVTNYAYAYRACTVKVLVDALESVFQASSKDLGLRLVVDVSHNGLQLETHKSEARWVSRHNNCRPIQGFPGIVAGSNDACSCIVHGLDGCEDWVTGYDHGVGTLLKNQSKSGKLEKDERDLYSVKIKMRRGTDAVVGRERFQIHDTTLIDEVMDKLSRAGIAGKTAHMRPLMTLKMVR